MKALKKIWQFYYQGFRKMPKWGRQLWLIILLKGIVIFVLIRFVFFPDFLASRFETDKERGDYVMEQLTTKQDTHDSNEH